jgi:hypothetical protein
VKTGPANKLPSQVSAISKEIEAEINKKKKCWHSSAKEIVDSCKQGKNPNTFPKKKEEGFKAASS